MSYYFNVSVDINQNLSQGQCVREDETAASIHPAIAAASSMLVSSGSVVLYINNLENLNLEDPMVLFTIHFAGSPGTDVLLDWRMGAGANQLISIPGNVDDAALSEPLVVSFPSYTISGTIIKPPFTQSNCDGAIDGAVPGVEVSLTTGFWCAPAQTGQIQINGSDGSYAFEVNRYFDYGIFPYKTDNPGCGVNSLDYYMVYQHLLGNNLLDYPWQFVAADMNLDRILTPGDAALIKQLVNGTFVPPDGWESWTFIPVKDYSFFPDVGPDYMYPTYEEAIYINDLNSDYPNQDFVGIKRADVDGSCSACTGGDGQMNGEGVLAMLKISDLSMEAGEILRLPVFLESPMPVGACAFALGFDPAYVDVLAVEPSEGLSWDEATINRDALAEGIVRLAWMSPQKAGMSVASDQPFLYLILQARHRIASLRPFVHLLPSLQDCSVVTTGLQVRKLALRFADPLSRELGVQPDAGSNYLSVIFKQSTEGWGRLQVFDVSGKQIFEAERFLTAGDQKWEIRIGDWPSGVYVVTLQRSGQVLSSRFVVAR